MGSIFALLVHEEEFAYKLKMRSLFLVGGVGGCLHVGHRRRVSIIVLALSGQPRK